MDRAHPRRGCRWCPPSTPLSSTSSFPSRVPGTRMRSTLAAPPCTPGGLPLDRRDFARFEKRLEPPQVLPDLDVRLLAEGLGDRRPELAAGRVVLKVHADPCAMLRFVEVH